MKPRTVTQSHVDVRARVVEATPARGGQTSRETAYRIVVGELHFAVLETITAVDVDLGGPVDENVGDIAIAQEVVERSGADGLSPQRVDKGQNGRVAVQATLGAKGVGDVGRGRFGTAVGKGAPNRLDELRRHRRHVATRSSTPVAARTFEHARPNDMRPRGSGAMP